MMVDRMFIMVQSSRMFSTAVTPTAAVPTWSFCEFYCLPINSDVYIYIANDDSCILVYFVLEYSFTSLFVYWSTGTHGNLYNFVHLCAYYSCICVPVFLCNCMLVYYSVCVLEYLFTCLLV